MPVRTTMSALNTQVALMIGDASNVQFTQQQVQDTLDRNRQDVRYESLIIAPSIVNTASTNNVASTIFADFYSQYGWWEADIVLQAYYGGAAWVVVTPVSSELLLEQAHFVFEANVFTSGTVPGQTPPVFATGKVFDIYSAAADLLEFWAASYAGRVDVTMDGQTARLSQLMSNKLKAANIYRMQAKPKIATMTRGDIMPELSTRRVRLLDEGDSVKGRG